jgi:hypothetical protein
MVSGSGHAFYFTPRKAVLDLRRGNVFDVRVFDSGVDGDPDGLADNKVFARPGIFVP